MSDSIAALCRVLGHAFRDQGLLLRALTHRSRSAANYERLEFLGDGLLNFVIAAELYRRFPELSEGELTRVRARLVREEALAERARALDLGSALQLGGGELKSGGFDRSSILADALEAVVGACYVDAGWDTAQAVVVRLYAELLERLEPATLLKDPKTRLQELLQGRGAPVPQYDLLETTGEPPNQRFVVQCHAQGMAAPARGEGGSRRAAEQVAAEGALQQLGADRHG